MNKRNFIKLSSAAIVFSSLGSYPLWKHFQPKTPFLFSSSKGRDGFYLSVANKEADLLYQYRLPGRGHDSVFHPFKEELVTIARRPGNWFCVTDIRSEQAPLLIKADHGRHFFGHGVFSPDGGYLFMTENNYSKGTGVIGIYDALHGYQKVNEVSSYGIGPHQLQLLNDGKTIVVANGGIRTHPDQLRKKLNLETMRSSLSYINSDNGHLIEYVNPTLQRASIRHLDVALDDTVVVGMQYQRDSITDTAVCPLVAFHRQGQSLEYADVESDHWQGYNDYTGSICCHHSTSTVCITSPRGNLSSIWDIASRQLIQQFSLADVCGVGQQQHNFILTTGHGDVITIDAAGAGITQAVGIKRLQWDNHLLIRTA